MKRTINQTKYIAKSVHSKERQTVHLTNPDFSWQPAYGNELSFTASSESLASITSAIVTSITGTTAVSGGDITDDNGSDITAKGVCWSLTENPTIADSHTSDGTGIGVFTSNLTELTGVTTYYVRAYSTNSAGTSYGNQVSFITI